jgi:hypothetical protein
MLSVFVVVKGGTLEHDLFTLARERDSGSCIRPARNCPHDEEEVFEDAHGRS